MKTWPLMLLLIAGLGLPGAAGATYCWETSPAEAFDRADAVFAGFAMGSSIAPEVNRYFGHGMRKWSFDVTHVWKGDVRDTLYVVTDSRMDPGSYRFWTGEHYIVYGRGALGYLVDGQCSRSRPVRYALWDRYWLPEPTVVKAGMEIPRITLQAMFAALASEDRQMRYLAATDLGGMVEHRAEIVARMSAVIRGTVSGDKWMAVYALRVVGPEAEPAVSDLVWALENGDESLRKAVVEAIVQILGPRSLEYLAIGMSDDSPSVRERAYERARTVVDGIDEAFREVEVSRLRESDAFGDPQFRLAALQILEWLREADVRGRK